MIAAQDIKAGELLLSEQPVLCGPYWDCAFNCLNCYAPSDTTCKWDVIHWSISFDLFSVAEPSATKLKKKCYQIPMNHHHNLGSFLYNFPCFFYFPFLFLLPLESAKWCHCAGIAMIIMTKLNVKHWKSLNCPTHFYLIISMLWHRCVFYYYFIDMLNFNIQLQMVLTLWLWIQIQWTI